MKIKKINGRKLRYGGTSLVLTALIIAVVVMINVICTALTQKQLLKIDLTPEELYTLSDEFITLIEEGDDTYSQSAEAPIAMIDKFRAEKDDPSLKINIIFCEEKDKIYGEATTRYVQQTAEQIKEEFDGYVTVEYVDVERNPSAVSKFKVTSDVVIPSTSVIVEFDGQYKILSLESFYVFAESDPSTPVGYTGEKKFASAILAVTRTSTPIACLTNNHGENLDNLTEFKTTLEDAGYEVQTLNLEKDDIPKDCRLVVVFGPQNDFMSFKTGTSDIDEIGKLENFLLAGNSMMVFMDPESKKLENFEEFVAEWGIVFNRNATTGDAQYVVDKNQALNASGQTFKAMYPASGLGHDILGGMVDEGVKQTIVFKNAMSISLAPEFKMQHYTPTDSTNAEDVAYDYGYNDPYSLHNIFTSSRNATSVSNGEIIANTANEPYRLMTVSDYTINIQTDAENGFSTTIKSYVVACGSTEFASNELLQTNSYGNNDALLMIMANVGLEVVPVGLKYKPFADTTIDTLEASDATVYTVILVVLPAIAAIVSGAVVLVRRRYR